MTNIQQTYLELLKAAIWSGDELTSERVKELTSERVSEVIRLSAFQGIGPLVYDQLLKISDLKLSAELRMHMKQQCVSNIMLQNSMMPLLIQAWNALVNAEIHPVLLKGFGLAHFYPQPHLRQWGDIDIYVGQMQYHEACAVLRSTFFGIPHPDEDDEERKHYNFDFDNTAIETHRVSMTFSHPCDRRYYECLEEMYLTKDGPKVELEGLTVTIPEDTFNLFFTFLHAWHHFVETGMNMKQVCDVAVLLHAKRDVIDRERLKEMLRKLYLLEVWQLFMYIITNYLGVPEVECPFYTDACQKRAELLFERVLIEGTARKSPKLSADGVSYLKRKWMTFQSRMADSRLLMPYAPKYAWHKITGDVLHGIERTLKLK